MDNNEVSMKKFNIAIAIIAVIVAIIVLIPPILNYMNTPDLESCDAIIWASQRGYSRDMVIGVKDNKFYDLTYKLSGAHRILTGNEFDSYKYSNSEKYCPLKIISNTSDSYRDEYYSNELMFEYKYDESYTVVIDSIAIDGFDNELYECYNEIIKEAYGDLNKYHDQYWAIEVGIVKLDETYLVCNEHSSKAFILKRTESGVEIVEEYKLGNSSYVDVYTKYATEDI